MTTGALQHLLVRARRWWMVRHLRSRVNMLTTLIDNVERDLAQDAALLVNLRAEMRHVVGQLHMVQQSQAAARPQRSAEA